MTMSSAVPSAALRPRHRLADALLPGLLLLVLGSCADSPLTPETDAALAVTGAAGQHRVRVLVRLRGRADQAAVVQQSRAQGARILRQYEHLPMLALEVSANALPGLRRAPGVLSVMEDILLAPILNSSLPVIQANQAHALGWQGNGVTVAILDTGIDPDHPFFAGRVVEEVCFSSEGSSSPFDTTVRKTLCPDGSLLQTGPGAANIEIDNCRDPAGANICTHGPHVAGIAAGAGAGVPNAPTAGVAPGATIIAVQVFHRVEGAEECDGQDACVRAFSSDWFAGLDWLLGLAGTYDIAAANLSLGSAQTFDGCSEFTGGVPVATANFYFKSLRDLNIAPLVAAGNSGSQGRMSFPACAGQAIAIGATDNADAVAAFSNRGFGLDLFAPGVDIQSAVSVQEGTGFGSKSGTSMATPHGSGAWAVLRQAFPAMSVFDMLKRLHETGVPIQFQIFSGGQSQTLTRSRIDLLGALLGTPVLTAEESAVNVPEGDPANTGGSYGHTDGRPVTLSASLGSVTAGGNDTWSWSFATTDGPAESQTVTITGTDDQGLERSIRFALVVENVPPVVAAGSGATIESGETFDLAGSFSDPGLLDAPWSYTVDWGFPPLSMGSMPSQGSITASRRFCAAGTYHVTLSVTDKDGGTGSDVAVVTVLGLGMLIDIKPAQDPTSIALSRGGRLPVAILSTAIFNAATVDPASVVIGSTPVDTRPNGRLFASLEDVNSDGLPDLLVHFRIPELVANGDLTNATTELTVWAFLDDGCTSLTGTQTVRVVP
jgi:subtilisin family serine protease